jgi:hypothetical protein
MSSVFGQRFNQIQPNKLYINLISLASTIVDSNNNLVTWALGGVSGTNNTVLGLLSTPGTAVLRDMGKNVYIPDPNVTTAVGSQSTILRRVQLVTTGTNGYYGTGDSASALAGSESDYFCGYIRLGAQTYAGGTGVPSGVARLN